MERFDLWCKEQEYKINKYTTVDLKLNYIESTISFYQFLSYECTYCFIKNQVEVYLMRLQWLKDKYMEVKGLC